MPRSIRRYSDQLDAIGADGCVPFHPDRPRRSDEGTSAVTTRRSPKSHVVRAAAEQTATATARFAVFGLGANDGRCYKTLFALDLGPKRAQNQALRIGGHSSAGIDLLWELGSRVETRCHDNETHDNLALALHRLNWVFRCPRKPPKPAFPVAEAQF